MIRKYFTYLNVVANSTNNMLCILLRLELMWRGNISGYINSVYRENIFMGCFVFLVSEVGWTTAYVELCRINPPKLNYGLQQISQNYTIAELRPTSNFTGLYRLWTTVYVLAELYHRWTKAYVELYRTIPSLK